MLRLAQVFLLADGWRRLALAALLGGLAALSLPPVGAFPVLALSFPGLVWLIDGAIPDRSRLRARLAPSFGIGWAFGFGFHLAGLWWIGRAFLVEADQFAALMPLAVLVLPAGLALFTGLAVTVAGMLWRDGWDRLLALALALTLGDWLRGNVLTGFPWNVWAHAFADSALLSQPVAFLGLYGLTFLVAFAFCALAGFADGTRGGRRVAVVAIGLLLVAEGAGAARMGLAPDIAPQDVALRLVQPSIPQEEKWLPENRSKVFSTYLEMSKAPWRDEAGSGDSGGLPRIVVWPESAIPFLLTETPDALAAIAALLGPRDTLVTGAVRADTEEGGRVFYNSVYAIGGDGEIRDAYDKVRLVPFGEYLPLESWLERLGLTKIVPLPGVFRAGFRARLLDPVEGPAFLPMICYEAIFPGAAEVEGARPGFLLNVTNDAWFGATSGPYQHFALARLRAIEQGLPLVRVANTGISAVFDPFGRVVAERGLGVVDHMDLRLPGTIQQGVSRDLREWALLIILILSLGVMVVTRYVGDARND
ncbi:apolipoprotein N-acyltransferase [Stappia sp.]|uniref:apolipoprotein N-acyltransferase n=1 Tax=Stappia sp. TaxID=1870903 RepID=UPI0025F2B1F7|nr:apolipoprotein N-acyltransferase [Stappia sp.]